MPASPMVSGNSVDLTKKQLEQRIQMATTLGFWCDVIHWKQELINLEKKDQNS